VGEGTSFVLLLPASNAKAARAPAQPPPKEIVGGSERILLVEDDPTVLALTLDVLTTLGYQVQTATQASEALELIQAGLEIDLLFTDVVMPGGVSGVALARTARELRPGLRVLLTSGFVGERQVIEGAEFPLLDKPYETPVLADMLRKLLDARQGKRRRNRERTAAE
jgi:CheY-like chemotaxis protein